MIVEVLAEENEETDPEDPLVLDSEDHEESTSSWMTPKLFLLSPRVGYCMLCL